MAKLRCVMAHFRAATPEDAPLLAELVNYAGEGMPTYLWGKLATPGETPWDVGRARARRAEGAFSYRNALMIEHEGEAAGCLIGYAIPDAPEPIPADMPAMFRPLQELENLAPATWYINVLAVTPQHRGKGLGAAMLARAEAIARQRSKSGLSLIVSDGNSGALRLYLRSGYAETARRPIVKDGWTHAGDAWLLLTKPF